MSNSPSSVTGMTHALSCLLFCPVFIWLLRFLFNCCVLSHRYECTMLERSVRLRGVQWDGLTSQIQVHCPLKTASVLQHLLLSVSLIQLVHGPHTAGLKKSVCHLFDTTSLVQRFWTKNWAHKVTNTNASTQVALRSRGLRTTVQLCQVLTLSLSLYCPLGLLMGAIYGSS